MNTHDITKQNTGGEIDLVSTHAMMAVWATLPPETKDTVLQAVLELEGAELMGAFGDKPYDLSAIVELAAAYRVFAQLEESIQSDLKSCIAAALEHPGIDIISYAHECAKRMAYGLDATT